MKFEVYCKYEDFSYHLNVYIFGIDHSGKRSFCKSIVDGKMEFVEYKEDQYIENPTFRLSGEVVKPFLQAMANELKEIGVTADGEPVLENELTAVKYHLEDMRKITFHKLGVNYKKAHVGDVECEYIGEDIVKGSDAVGG